MLRARPTLFCTALLSALGLVPACGGTADTSFPCVGSTPVGTSNTGYEQCGDNGPLHRPKIEECPSSLPRSGVGPEPSEFNQCVTDADCTERPHGYCGFGLGNAPGAACAYGCVNDAECGAGSICVCGEAVGHCVQASCSSDAACGAGFLCQSYDSSMGCGFQAFACQTQADTCGSDADCDGAYCVAKSGHFECVQGGCAIGRPFLVEGSERVAALVDRKDWLEPGLVLDVSAVAPRLRQHAAEAWARIGQMEHASVAAFARFALQLLQLGAPPELIERATQAMADETRHAKLAFAVASRLGSRVYGPGSLDVTHSLSETELLEVVRLVMREGCIGETVAALEAREAAEHAAQAELQGLLRRIADDEARHAELAWRFVGWALEQQPGPVAEVVRSELARAVAETHGAPSAPPIGDSGLLALGVVPESLRRQLRAAALLDVVQPCAAALLAAAGGRPESSAFDLGRPS